MEELLQGIFDMHIHTAPDLKPRKCDDFELGQRLTAAGMAGCVIKNHYADTSARASLMERLFPTLTVRGGIALNRSAGGLNPDAVERCAQMGGKFVWLPTLEALEYQKFHHRDDSRADLSKFISVCDENGKLLPAAHDVLETAAHYNLVVGTGHIGAYEGLEVVREAARLGCRIVLTHADNPADLYTVEEQQMAVRMGALVEHSYFTTYHNRTSIQEIAAQIRAVGYENVFLSTDFGQTNSPYSDEGMLQYVSLLKNEGFSLDELRHMTCTLPRELLG